VQLHLGGGTPTFLADSELELLLQAAHDRFNFSDASDVECSIEIDPRGVDVARLKNLRSIGFNRISLGIQDFDPRVQLAVHRIQSPNASLELIESAKSFGFQSTNVDLIYGLPFQTVESFSATVKRLMHVAPDRLSIFNYAHLPRLFMPQRRINTDDLPSSSQKLSILEATINILADHGYEYIGMDHFAKPGDALARARQKGTLHRNFQGYSTFSDCDLIGMGVSSISQIDQCYAQNHKDLGAYVDSVANDQLPIARGIRLSSDDGIRRHIIEQISCYYRVDLDAVCRNFGIKSSNCFADEWRNLKVMQQDGLVTLQKHGHLITVTEAGRFLLRNICMVFDSHLGEQTNQTAYSKVI
jgi:oxygen-independent coproporphyrinogen III oxidase